MGAPLAGAVEPASLPPAGTVTVTVAWIVVVTVTGEAQVEPASPPEPELLGRTEAGLPPPGAPPLGPVGTPGKLPVPVPVGP